MRLKPPSLWQPGDVGSVLRPGGEYEIPATIEDARQLAGQEDTSLRCLHYQFDGFEHYDVVTFEDGRVGCTAETSTRIISFATASGVAKSLADGHVDAARRFALGILEKVLPEPSVSGSSTPSSFSDDDAGEDIGGAGHDATEWISASGPPSDMAVLDLGAPALPADGSFARTRKLPGDVKFCDAYGRSALTSKHPESGGPLPDNTEGDAPNSEADSMSSISDDSDIYHLAVDADKTWTTEQDRDWETIGNIAARLRRRPLLPPFPNDATRDWTEVSGGVALPRAHSAFKNCTWTCDIPRWWEQRLADHVKRQHLGEMALTERDQVDFMAFYCAAIAVREREGMPAVGVSIDRRTFKLLADVYNGDVVYNLVCFICAQSKTHTGLTSRDGTVELSDIQFKSPGWLHQAFGRHPDSTERHLGLSTYVERYASEASSPMTNAPELRATDWEWKRWMEVAGGLRFALICCPEDVECAAKKHAPGEICKRCRVPVCESCAPRIWKGQGIPMALANDNLWGYAPALIAKYKVRWIEMAAVLPCWTSMIVYYIEGDHGHLMNEKIARPHYRRAVRGHCFSFLMPWQDILRDLQKSMTDAELNDLPREDQGLKYMLRLHLKVAGKDFHQHLIQVHLRPFVLIQLFNEMIDRQHEVFRNKGTATALKARMAARVAERYPETEPGVPEQERKGSIPPALLELLLADEEKQNNQEGRKRDFSLAFEKMQRLATANVGSKRR